MVNIGGFVNNTRNYQNHSQGRFRWFQILVQRYQIDHLLLVNLTSNPTFRFLIDHALRFCWLLKKCIKSKNTLTCSYVLQIYGLVQFEYNRITIDRCIVANNDKVRKLLSLNSDHYESTNWQKPRKLLQIWHCSPSGHWRHSFGYLYLDIKTAIIKSLNQSCDSCR